MYDAISINNSLACPTSECAVDDDRSAADKGRKPLSCGENRNNDLSDFNIK